MQKGQMVGVSLLNREKARGFWAYCPVFSLLPHRGTEEGKALVGGGRFGRSGPRRRPGVEGKGGEGPAGSISSHSSARGSLRWPSHCGRRRRRWRPWTGIPEGRRRSRGGGGAPMGLRGVQAYLGSGRGAVERGLRGGRRWQWQAAALQARGGGLGWRWWSAASLG